MQCAMASAPTHTHRDCAYARTWAVWQRSRPGGQAVRLGAPSPVPVHQHAGRQASGYLQASAQQIRQGAVMTAPFAVLAYRACRRAGKSDLPPFTEVYLISKITPITTIACIEAYGVVVPVGSGREEGDYMCRCPPPQARWKIFRRPAENARTPRNFFYTAIPSTHASKWRVTMSDPETATDNQIRFFRLPEVLAIVQVSRAQIYRLISDGRFPPPIKLGRVSLWSYEQLRKWTRDVTGDAGSDALERASRSRSSIRLGNKQVNVPRDTS